MESVPTTSSPAALAVASLSLDATALTQMELSVSRPRPNPLDGSPVESCERFFDDGVTVAGVWQCTPGRFAVEKIGTSSFMYFLAGRGTVTRADGTAHEIQPGAFLVTPDGFRGEWDIRQTTRKLYVITRREVP
jgi:uncharacterized protein